MGNKNIQTLKGFRDFLPDEKKARDFVEEKLVEVFQGFGFSPLETPTLEYAELLLGKYGNEADKLVYSFEDKGERKVALRYDQTVPTTRVLSQYKNDLPKYFRRYQIQNVFRAEKPQKGRYREFKQCDIDIFGSTDPIADAEILACTYFAFKKVGFGNVTLRINDREVLFKTLSKFETKDVTTFSIIQSIDKLDKNSESSIVDELSGKGLSKSVAKEALDAVKNIKPSVNIQSIINFAVNLGVPATSLAFYPTLARGLDYYTGMIFEIIIPDYPYGSCGGGGRYDKLIGKLGGTDIPAVGVGIGFDRTVEAAIELKLINYKRNTKTLITVFDEKCVKISLELASNLRNAQISCEIYPNSSDQISKQLKYADANKFDYAVIIGPDEILKKIITIKDLDTKKQESLPLTGIISKLSRG